MNEINMLQSHIFNQQTGAKLESMAGNGYNFVQTRNNLVRLSSGRRLCSSKPTKDEPSAGRDNILKVLRLIPANHTLISTFNSTSEKQY